MSTKVKWAVIIDIIALPVMLFVFFGCTARQQADNFDGGTPDPAAQYEIVGDLGEGIRKIKQEQDYKFGMINAAGKVIVAPCYDFMNDSFTEGLIGVKSFDKWGAIDKEGKVVIPVKYFEYQQVLCFEDGLAAVIMGTERFDPQGKWVYINKNDEVVLDIPGLSRAEPFSEGRAFVKTKESGKWGIIDTKGNFIVEPIFEVAASFSEGLAAVMADNKYGYVDLNGNVVIPYQYDTAWDFENKKAKVEKDGKQYYIDKRGKVLKSITE
ncbi:MAG: KWG Leptospira [Firmicutes bacterium ADurb.Bin193]|nr:MAG: KWG Leptospira [Firmicutes bacterium ADurb.Bin193]